MFDSIREWFTGPTPEEAYANGRACCDAHMTKGTLEGVPTHVTADHLYAMAYDGFNMTAAHRAFDKGVQDRLAELGFECPY